MFRAQCAHHQEVKIVLFNIWYHHTCRWPSRAQVLSQPVHGTATYRCDGTRGCIIQFWPPDDKHMWSKYVEAWNKLIIKFSSSSWLILRQIYWDARSAKYIKKKISNVQKGGGGVFGMETSLYWLKYHEPYNLQFTPISGSLKYDSMHSRWLICYGKDRSENWTPYLKLPISKSKKGRGCSVGSEIQRNERYSAS